MRSLLAAFLTVAGLAIAAVPVGATGGSGPAYRADIAPGTAPAGKTSELVITVTQLSDSSSKKVRTVKVSAPGDLTITAASARDRNGGSLSTSSSAGQATVTNIPYPGKNKVAAIIKLDVAIPCGVGGTRTWAVVARNSSNVELGQDPASVLTTSIARCSLSFKTQPASAQRDATITSVVADPSGERVKVRLLDGTGAPASQSGVSVSLSIASGPGTLGGDTQDATNSDGVAVFEPTIGTSERGYRLEANASGIIGSGPSSAFDINDVAKVCSGACSGSSERGTTSATISSSSNGGVLTMSLGLDELSCDNAANNFYKSTSSPITWDITPANDRTVITIRLDSSDVTRPYNLYDVCFSSPVSSFRNRYNVKIAAGEAGLLKICPPRLDKQDADPCVVDKWRENGDVLIRFSVPAGDPRGRI